MIAMICVLPSVTVERYCNIIDCIPHAVTLFFFFVTGSLYPSSGNHLFILYLHTYMLNTLQTYLRFFVFQICYQQLDHENQL